MKTYTIAYQSTYECDIYITYEKGTDMLNALTKFCLNHFHEEYEEGKRIREDLKGINCLFDLLALLQEDIYSLNVNIDELSKEVFNDDYLQDRGLYK